MPSIQLLRSVGGRQKDQIISVGQGQAEHLIANGYAKAVEEPEPESKPEPKRRTRARKAQGGGGDSPSKEPTTAG